MSKTGRNLASAFLSQIIRYLAPLAFYPFLTRALSAEGFAVFALGLAAAQIVGQIIEFGFGLSGVRRFAEGGDVDEERARVFGDVVLGRMLLCVAVACCGLAVWLVLPRENIGAGVFAAIAILGSGYGFSASWYYIAKEQAARLAFQEVCVSFTQLALLLAFVRQGDGAWLALLLIAVPVWVAVFYGHGVALREHGVFWPGRRRLQTQFVEAFHFFCFTGLTPIMNRANLIILGAMAPPLQVAYFAIGERIVTAVANAGIPLTRVMMPKICGMLQNEGARARAMFRKTLAIMVGLAAAGAAIGVALAPWGLEFIFGPEMRAAYPVVAIQLCLVPLMLCSRMIGTLALVPLHREKAYQRIVLVFGALGLFAAPMAIMLGEGVGLALARFAIEHGVVILCVRVLVQSENRWLGATAEAPA